MNTLSIRAVVGRTLSVVLVVVLGAVTVPSTVSATVTVLYSGQLLEYGSSSTSSWDLVQATGPVYSSIVGSSGWVWGDPNNIGSQVIAQRFFTAL